MCTVASGILDRVSSETRGAARGILARLAEHTRGYRSRVAVGDFVAIAVGVIAAQMLRFEPLLELFGMQRSGFDATYSLFSIGMIASWLISLAVFRTRDEKFAGSGPTMYELVVKATLWKFGFRATPASVLCIPVAWAYIPASARPLRSGAISMSLPLMQAELNRSLTDLGGSAGSSKMEVRPKFDAAQIIADARRVVHFRPAAQNARLEPFGLAVSCAPWARPWSRTAREVLAP